MVDERIRVASRAKKSKESATTVDSAKERINPALLPLAKEISKLKLDPENAREHDDRNLEAIKFSLVRFGQQKPIVCLRDGTVYAGNGLMTAAKSLGWKRVAAVMLETNDRNEAKAFALADNRSAELSRWDHEQLGVLLAQLGEVNIPVVDLGWTEQEVSMLIAADYSPGETSSDGLGDGGGDSHSVKLTHDQYEVLKRAMTRVREDEGDASITDGRCIELIAADFLA
jgi:hypothetical protein